LLNGVFYFPFFLPDCFPGGNGTAVVIIHFSFFDVWLPVIGFIFLLVFMFIIPVI